MDFRAVLVFLCLIVAQVICDGDLQKNINKEALTRTIQMLQDKDLRPLLKNISEQLTNMECRYLNTTQLGELQEQRFTAYHLSSFTCYIYKLSQLGRLSELFPHLPKKLQKISEIIKNMTERYNDMIVRDAPEDGTACEVGSLSHLEDEALAVYVKCLLQHLDQRLSNAKF